MRHSDGAAGSVGAAAGKVIAGELHTHAREGVEMGVN